MKVVVVRDGFFYKGKGGVPYSKIVNYENFSSRYLAGFENVDLVGRLYDLVDSDAKPVVGEGVNFVAIDGYTGVFGFLKSAKKIFTLAFAGVQRGNAYILRLPATVPIIYGLILYLKKIPYGVELVGDPYDAYSPNVLSSKFAFIYQRIFTLLTRFIVKNSVVAAYVTAHTLQLSYPTRIGVGNFSYTSLDIGDEAFISSPRGIDYFNKTEFVISHVGMMAKNYKGHDILIKAIKIVLQRGYFVKVKFVGDGAEREKYQKLVEELDLVLNFDFLGGLPAGKKVWDVLDSSDIFVLPSRQEGLPRAMIEAMARGVPCIGSKVGGIPELLDSNCIVECENSLALADKICEFIDNPKWMTELSSLLLNRSKKYHRSCVSKERLEFYRSLRNSSQG